MTSKVFPFVRGDEADVDGELMVLVLYSYKRLFQSGGVETLS